MEARGGADQLGVTLQVGAAGELPLFELLDAREVAVDEDAIGERPQVLSWRQLGRIGRQEEQVHLLWHPQTHAGRFPARPIEHEDKLLGGTGSHGSRACGELDCKERDAHAGWQMGQMEEGPTRSRMHQANEVTPGEAMAYHGHGALADRGPHPTPQWLEAAAMFIGHPHSPQLDLRLREGGGDRP